MKTGALGFLPQCIDQPLHLTAIALDHGGKLRTLGRCHADTFDPDIVDFVSAVLRCQQPINTRWRLAICSDNLARNQLSVGLRARADDALTFTAIFGQPISINKRDRVGQEFYEFLLLGWSGNAPVASEDKTGDVRNIEVLSK